MAEADVVDVLNAIYTKSLDIICRRWGYGRTVALDNEIQRSIL